MNAVKPVNMHNHPMRKTYLARSVELALSSGMYAESVAQNKAKREES